MAVLGRTFWTLFALWVAMLAFALCVGTAHAREPYTSDDTYAAIAETSAEIGVSAAYLTAIVRCETGGSFSNYLVGRQGELGAVQLHPRGELLRFRSWGYLDPFSPYQSVRFLAQRIVQGGAAAWSCS